MEDYKKGDRVSHPIHGFGTVVDVAPFNGEPKTPGNTATIVFDVGVRQTFMLKYAPLRPLTEAELRAQRINTEAHCKQQSADANQKTAQKPVRRICILKNIARNIAHKFSMSASNFGDMACASKIPEVKINLLTGGIEPEYFQTERNYSLAIMCKENLARLLGDPESARIVEGTMAELVATFDLNSMTNDGWINAAFTVTLTTDTGKTFSGTVKQPQLTELGFNAAYDTGRKSAGAESRTYKGHQGRLRLINRAVWRLGRDFALSSNLLCLAARQNNIPEAEIDLLKGNITPETLNTGDNIKLVRRAMKNIPRLLKNISPYVIPPSYARIYAKFNLDYARGPGTRLATYIISFYADEKQFGRALEYSATLPLICRAEPFQVRIRFNHEAYGWATLTISAGGQSVNIECSDAYSPFIKLRDWARTLANGGIPATLGIDEESGLKNFSVYPAKKEGKLLLHITGGTFEGRTYLKTLFQPEQVAAEFRRELRRFLLEDFDPERWQDDDDNKDGGSDLSTLPKRMFADNWLAVSQKEREFLSKYAEVRPLSEGMHRVASLRLDKATVGESDWSQAEPGIWGYATAAGEEIVKPQYLYAEDFKNGTARVCRGVWENGEQPKDNDGYYKPEQTLWGLIDKSGREVIPCRFYRDLQPVEGGKYYIAESTPGAKNTSLVLNPSGEVLFYPDGQTLITYERNGIVKVARAQYPHKELEGLFDIKRRAWLEDHQCKNIRILIGLYDLKSGYWIFECRFKDIEYRGEKNITLTEFNWWEPT